jgi:hypothetical protein
MLLKKDGQDDQEGGGPITRDPWITWGAFNCVDMNGIALYSIEWYRIVLYGTAEHRMHSEACSVINRKARQGKARQGEASQGMEGHLP